MLMSMSVGCIVGTDADADFDADTSVAIDAAFPGWLAICYTHSRAGKWRSALCLCTGEAKGSEERLFSPDDRRMETKLNVKTC